MADYYALTAEPLPRALHGTDGPYSIRTLSDAERLTIEDYFSKKEIKVALSTGATAIVLPQSDATGASLEDIPVLIEFALGILTVSGYQAIQIVATLNATTCTGALVCPSRSGTAVLPIFAKKVIKAAASTWIRKFFAARMKSKNRLRITAERFVRYLRAGDSYDGLVDLCISLESVLESQTEISFRFSTCLAVISGLKNPEEISKLLSDLYDLRSKVVHGVDYTKQHKKIVPTIDKVRFTARAVLTAYVLYLSEHTPDEWKQHLLSSLFRVKAGS